MFTQWNVRWRSVCFLLTSHRWSHHVSLHSYCIPDRVAVSLHTASLPSLSSSWRNPYLSHPLFPRITHTSPLCFKLVHNWTLPITLPRNVHLYKVGAEREEKMFNKAYDNLLVQGWLNLTLTEELTLHTYKF